MKTTLLLQLLNKGLLKVFIVHIVNTQPKFVIPVERTQDSLQHRSWQPADEGTFDRSPLWHRHNHVAEVDQVRNQFVVFPWLVAVQDRPHIKAKFNAEPRQDEHSMLSPI